MLCAYVLSHFSRVQLAATLWPWTVACLAPLSMGLSRQEYWSGLPCPPPGHLPDPGIKPYVSHVLGLMLPALAGRFFATSGTWEDTVCVISGKLFGLVMPWFAHLKGEY